MKPLTCNQMKDKGYNMDGCDILNDSRIYIYI